MFGKSKSKTGNSSTSGTSVKKPPPPRPPPPAIANNIPRSASVGFDPWNEHKSRVVPIVRTQTVGCTYNITNRSDLIDLSSPSNSPPTAGVVAATPNFPGATSNEVPDFKYHVGASIFYIKSELKGTGIGQPVGNPFSPPRPSQQTLSNSASASVKVSTTTTKQPTIIKASAQTSDSRNNNTYVPSNTAKGPPPAVLLDWDEPPKKTYAPPTVIRPIPPPKKPGLSSKRLSDRNSLTGPPPSFVPPPVAPAVNSEHVQPRYDQPPEESDGDFEDSFDFPPVPEPAGPPPPPPQELDQFSTSETGEKFVYSSHPSSQDYVRDASDRAYGIALYEYVSGEAGDLQFAVGDVIYLTRVVDESWLHGSCGGMEGMFPANFINVVVPLEGQLMPHSAGDSYGEEYEEPPYYPTHYVLVLHDFQATEPTDLTIRDGDIVTVIGQVNEDWLYGELNGMKGQFPKNFIEYVPVNLPLVHPHAQ